MKTKLFSSLLLSASLLSLHFGASAQTDPPGTFQAACYPIQHTLKCRVMFVNPEAKPVTIVIRDAAGQSQHEETVYHLTKFNRRYDLAPLGDGTYTLEVRQGKLLFSQSIQVETTYARSMAMTPKPARETPLPVASTLASTNNK